MIECLGMVFDNTLSVQELVGQLPMGGYDALRGSLLVKLVGGGQVEAAVFLVVLCKENLSLGVVFLCRLFGPVEGAVVFLFGVVVHDADLCVGMAFFGQ